MNFPRHAFLALGSMLGTVLICATVGQAFPPPAPGSRSDREPFSVPTLVHKLRPRVAVLQASLEHDPGQADLLVALGEELEQIGDLSRAVGAYNEALLVRPDHARAFYGFWHNRLKLRERETNSAPAAPERRAAVGGKDPAAGSQTDSENAWEQGRSFRGAVQELAGVAGADSEDAEAMIRLGRRLLGAGDLDAAIGQYRAVLAAHAYHADAHHHLARALMLKRRWDQASAHLEQAVRLSPDLAGAHYALGLVRYQVNDVEGSIQAFEDALRADPSEAQARFQLGLLLRLTGHEEEGFGHLLEAARRGVPQAQYLVGAAYQSGQGVTPDLGQAVAWWFRAAGQGVPAARDGLARLRLAALRSAPLRAPFQSYRNSLWEAYPELARAWPEESLGLHLLQRGRAQEALPILIQEAAALSPVAHRALETLYEVGLEGMLEPHDPAILKFFEDAAAEGLPSSLLVLARIYYEGLGVAPDRSRAARLLRSYRPDRIADPMAWPGLRAAWSASHSMR